MDHWSRCAKRFAALPQHSAISLWLTVGTTHSIKRLCLCLDSGGAASMEKWKTSPGKPEAFRTGRRRSREMATYSSHLTTALPKGKIKRYVFWFTSSAADLSPVHGTVFSSGCCLFVSVFHPFPFKPQGANTGL